MNKSSIYLFLIFLLFTKTSAQNKNDSLQVGIRFKWKTENLELNKNYISINDTLQLNAFKFYISKIEINYTDGTTFKEKNSYHLIDIQNEDSKTFAISRKEQKTISKLVFSIGIDSTASVSGALSGDLDVQNGMYWAWQSGYINMKVEGKSKSCTTRKNAFQFHIGGYIKPYCALREVSINFNDNSNTSNEISIQVDVAKLFENIDLSDTNSIMIPGEKAMKLADQSVKMFAVE
jgi:hypothetical protein